MKSAVYRYSLYGAICLTVLTAVHLFLIMPYTNYEVSEASGYLTIFISMIFVFLGIRHYRNHVNEGFMTFGQGLKMGVLIILLPSVLFGLIDVLYTEVIDPEWSEKYFAHYIERVKSSTPPEKLAAALEQAQAQKEFFSNPILQFLVMAATVFIIGLIVAIISSLSLMRKKKPAIA